MSEFAGFDLDRSTARAWSVFRGRLADLVAAMEDDDLALVEAESSVNEKDEGAAPYVQFCAWGDDLVRCEVSSNAYLADEQQLDDEQAAALVALGWNAPTSLARRGGRLRFDELLPRRRTEPGGPAGRLDGACSEGCLRGGAPGVPLVRRAGHQRRSGHWSCG